MSDIEKRKQSDVTRKQQQDNYYIPAVDIWETEDAIEMQVDMPGVAKEDVDINVERNSLVLHGKRGKLEGSSVYTEAEYGDFHREFTLSDDLDTSNITAKMNNGVLQLSIAKSEQVKPRKIEIATA